MSRRPTIAISRSISLKLYFASWSEVESAKSGQPHFLWPLKQHVQGRVLQNPISSAQGCGINGFIPTSVIQGNPLFTWRGSLWGTFSCVTEVGVSHSPALFETNRLCHIVLLHLRYSPHKAALLQVAEIHVVNLKFMG